MAIWLAVRMPNPIKVLLLGGTSEARMLAAHLDGDERFTVETSLAGATENPLPVEGERRRGGFGGTVGLVDYLRAVCVDIVIDGTHAFAAKISRNAAEACDQTRTERLVVQRPAWEKTEGDHWLEVSDVPEAAEVVAQHGCRVFLTIGPQDIAAFSSVAMLGFSSAPSIGQNKRPSLKTINFCRRVAPSILRRRRRFWKLTVSI